MECVSQLKPGHARTSDGKSYQKYRVKKQQDCKEP